MKKTTKRPKTFKKFKCPRFIPGTVPKDKWKADLKEYNNHRYKVFSAKCIVDDAAPKLNPYNSFNTTFMYADVHRLREIDRQNNDLLKKINTINKLGGLVDTFNPRAYQSFSRWSAQELRMRQIYYKNLEIYKVISNVRSEYSVKNMNEHWKKILTKLQLSCKLPFIIADKINHDKLLKANKPSVCSGLSCCERKANRPLCFMEFKVLAGEALGRVIIELYSDFVPRTVQNFVDICSGTELTYKNCLVHRIIRGKCMVTGDITCGNGRGGYSIYGSSFTEEPHVLKHSKPGVLSMVRVEDNKNNSQFSISFSDLPELDRRNVVFGCIVRGIDVIYKIEGFGRKIGKPLADIVISKCGPFKFTAKC